MTFKYVSIEKEGGLALVRFDRNENKNAFNQDLVLELTSVARSFHDDLETHAVILTGAANAFSAGADLRDAASWDISNKTDLELRERFYRGVRLCKAWEEMPQITIAAIEGMAVGAGVAIAIACDWRVMARDAYLYVPEVKIGLNLQWGALPRLITLVGPARAKRITLLCERMDAETALAWGLVEELAEGGGSVEKAKEMAETTLQMPATTVRMVKEAVNATATALHRASCFADGDQSQLTGSFQEAQAAPESFAKRR